jgi:hypothetical protein
VNADWFSTIFVLSAQLSPRLGFFFVRHSAGLLSKAACGLEKMAQKVHINGAFFS